MVWAFGAAAAGFEAAGRLGLRGAGSRPLLPILIAAGDDVDLARAVEAEGDGDGSVEEVAVVADDEDGAVIVGDHLLEQVEGLEVEVVGRLVEDEQVRAAGEFAGEEQARPLAPGQGSDLRIDEVRLEQELL